MQLWFPFLMYYVVVPILFPVYDESDPSQEPPSIESFLFKMICGFMGCFLFAIGALYYQQSSFLYVPAAPF